MDADDTSAFDNAVRLAVYDGFVHHGRAPDYVTMAARTGAPVSFVREAIDRLADQHVLVLNPAGDGIWMAMPFSAVETSFRVRSSGSEWWANCAWDALGFAAMLDRTVSVSARCGESGESLEFEVTGETVTGDPAVVHMQVPAATWWNDIGFT